MKNLWVFSLLVFSFLLLFYNKNAQARPFVSDMSIRAIEINSSYNGTEILLFGARNDAGDIVVVVRGAEQNYIVRKKERVAGIWMNSQRENFYNISGFYAIASTVPLAKIQNDVLLKSLNISAEEWSFLSGQNSGNNEFQRALLENKWRDNLYPQSLGSVEFIGDTLFRSVFYFPEKIPRGNYSVEVYLFNDGQLMGFQATPLSVFKSGVDAWLYDFSHDFSPLYGMIAVFLALFSGWSANVIFRKI
jgi:uncharacterized protein (TIGR02186 family)